MCNCLQMRRASRGSIFRCRGTPIWRVREWIDPDIVLTAGVTELAPVVAEMLFQVAAFHVSSPRSGWPGFVVQNSALPGVLGKGTTSRMFCMPVA